MLDLTFGPSFKVKRWFTGFGELSFRWIQICISSPMRRSSFFLNIYEINDLKPCEITQKLLKKKKTFCLPKRQDKNTNLKF